MAPSLQQYPVLGRMISIFHDWVIESSILNALDSSNCDTLGRSSEPYAKAILRSLRLTKIGSKEYAFGEGRTVSLSTAQLLLKLN